MEARATLRYTLISPQKTRLVVDQVRGKPIGEALKILKFMGKKRAHVVEKVLNSAVANALNTGVIDVDNLYVKSIVVNEGPTLKRFRPRAMGRATRIRKRTSHISVVLEEF
ncbi:MAG TPA: 50S ribosomal protein L22 [Deltaproteobacteria bacterium]|nr:50S ribosomal protein L22 [Deltaproteobacteria bacterium]HDM32313.1 50S ribosomal protein L22 [Deltaproteobacteria bacterium]